MKPKSYGIEWIAAAAAAVILAVLLLTGPVVGMADNGDFQRIMGTVGLGYTDPSMTYEDKFFGYFIREFKLTEMGLGGYVTSSLVPVLAAKGLSWALLRDGLFDMRMLAFLYIALFVAAAWMVLRYNRISHPAVRALLAVLFVLMFADVGYSAYYNSLFSEPVSLIFLLLTLGFALRMLAQEEPSSGALTGFFISALFLIAAKVQNAPVGILLALLIWRFASLRMNPGWRKRIYMLTGVLVLASAAIYFSLPREIKIINEYQTVFYGVLKGSDTPEQDLRELGLPEKLAVNAGTNYFEKAPIDQKDPVFANEYHPRFSHAKVGLFYLKHPVRFYHKLETAAENGFSIRPYYLGNYEKAEGRPRGALSDTFSYWSEFKHEVLPNRLWFIALVFAGYFGVLIRSYWRAGSAKERIYLELFAFVGLIGLLQFVTPVIGDGEADLGKHLFGFNISFDLMLLSSVVWLADRGLKLTRRFRFR
ncbi:glycan biosynthesis hexose transferase WsfD [Gorillibacterium sp. sgz5001074]|uniref:glycan biosynthesis hexose transferase WsfD n=1 Tax=Gorillibacterium sp. sgz5001074 TaxID=3446695 RepID=UPI003F67CEFF